MSEEKQGFISRMRDRFFLYCYKKSDSIYKIIYDTYFRPNLHKKITNINFNKNEIDYILDLKKSTIEGVKWFNFDEIPINENENDLKDIFLEEAKYKYFKLHSRIFKFHYYHVWLSIFVLPPLLCASVMKSGQKKGKFYFRLFYWYVLLSALSTAIMATIITLDSDTKPFLEKKFEEKIKIYNKLYEIYA